MYCMWFLGKWSEKQVQSCGFQSDEIQKPAALGITLVLPVPLAWGRGFRRGGCRESWREEGRRPVKAKAHDPPCPKGSPQPSSYATSHKQIPLWSVLQPWTMVCLQNLSIIRLSWIPLSQLFNKTFIYPLTPEHGIYGYLPYIFLYFFYTNLFHRCPAKEAHCLYHA